MKENNKKITEKIVKAVNKNVRSSTRKLKPILKAIVGKKVDLAIRDLSFSEKSFIYLCSFLHGLHQVAKKLTKTISFPNSLDDINVLSSYILFVSNFGVVLFSKLEGNSEGFRSIINR